jgi:lysine 2,3-aminomutase
MAPNKESLQRARELERKTVEYRAFKRIMQTQRSHNQTHYYDQKKRLLDALNGTEDDWNNWHWQMQHRITNVESLCKYLSFSNAEQKAINDVAKTNRFAIVPYYFALISDRKNDPIKAMSIPVINELNDITGSSDPMAEAFTNPAGSITRRYPDRLIINVTNVCAMYCRHCQRRRLIGETDHHTNPKQIEESIDYVRKHPEIRDVLLTGGDALLLSDQQLEQIIQELRRIDHVEIIRIGTRTPVTMPMRITDQLVSMLKRYHPIYLNTHYNHPNEVTTSSIAAIERLVNTGIPVGNQTVLLKGINDDPYVMMYLNQLLVQARVRPYYIFHAKSVTGTSHFVPSIKTGLQIMEFMRGNTSGLAIPTYIMNAPNGLGKVPLLPDYIVKKQDSIYTIRTWENNTFEYDDSGH